MELHRLRHRIARRRRQARWVLKRLPRRASVHRYPLIGRFAARLRADHFWCWTGWPLAVALYSGMCISFMPIGGVQIALAAAAAFVLRGNLPVAVAVQFLSNPFTAVPLYGMTGAVGWWPAELILPDAGLPLRTGVALVIGGFVCGVAVAGLIHSLHLLRTRTHRRDIRMLASLTT
jgi:hypothetical protein